MFRKNEDECAQNDGKGVKLLRPMICYLTQYEVQHLINIDIEE